MALFAVLAWAMVLAVVSAPLLGMTGHATAYLILHDIFSHICHQEPQRSFAMGGFAFPVCARCLGIYVGAAGGALLSLPRRWHIQVPAQIFWGALAANGIDVAMEMMHLHGNMPLMRLLLGLGFGMAAALFVAGIPGGPERHTTLGSAAPSFVRRHFPAEWGTGRSPRPRPRVHLTPDKPVSENIHCQEIVNWRI